MCLSASGCHESDTNMCLIASAVISQTQIEQEVPVYIDGTCVSSLVAVISQTQIEQALVYIDGTCVSTLAAGATSTVKSTASTPFRIDLWFYY
jgi:hypothetical protein